MCSKIVGARLDWFKNTRESERKEKSEALGSGRVYTQCVIYYQTKDITIKSNQKPSLDPTTGI